MGEVCNVHESVMYFLVRVRVCTRCIQWEKTCFSASSLCVFDTTIGKMTSWCLPRTNPLHYLLNSRMPLASPEYDNPKSWATYEWSWGEGILSAMTSWSGCFSFSTLSYSCTMLFMFQRYWCSDIWIAKALDAMNDRWNDACVIQPFLVLQYFSWFIETTGTINSRFLTLQRWRYD